MVKEQEKAEKGESGNNNNRKTQVSITNPAEELQNRLTPRIQMMTGCQKYWYLVVHKRWQWWWSVVAYIFSLLIVLLAGYVAVLYHLVSLLRNNSFAFD